MSQPQATPTEETSPTEARKIPVGLSTASVYPLGLEEAFSLAEQLGYDGVEVMVTNDKNTQEADELQALSEQYHQPILSIHAPTLLITQQVWGSAWNKISRSVDLAAKLGAPTVVAHPPFRWQMQYAQGFAVGIHDLQSTSGIQIAVENMYPWRVRGREIKAYLPHWDLRECSYDAVTWDLSHAATSGVSSLECLQQLGDTVKHLHLTDGSGAAWDEHLVPGRGNQQASEVLQYLGSSGFSGTVIAEISTRRPPSGRGAPGGHGAAESREGLLQETLAFAREHLGQKSH